LLTITIDWLAVNFKRWNDETEHFIRTYASADPVSATSARFGYSIATVDNNGVVSQWNPDRAEMGYHVIFAGSALRNIFSRTSVQPQELLRASLDAGGAVSRLDLAKDCTGEEINLSAIYQSLEQGLNIGMSRKFAHIESDNKGETIYVGSRQSERFIRIYNKAAESNLPGELWYRFELETKGMVSRALAERLVSGIDWSSQFDGLAKQMVNFRSPGDFAKFFTMGSVPIGLPKIERQSDREAWIASQIIPAVAKHYIENPNSEAVSRLIATLNLIDRQRKD